MGQVEQLRKELEAERLQKIEAQRELAGLKTEINALNQTIKHLQPSASPSILKALYVPAPAPKEPKFV